MDRMLIGDTNSMLEKLRRLPPPMNAVWRRVQARAVQEPEEGALAAFFVGALTGNRACLEKAAEGFRRRMSTLDAECRVWGFHAGAQMHTWCHSAPLMRWAVAYDWIADEPGLFTEEEKRGWAEQLVRYGWLYPAQFLDSRTPPHTNNQGLSMAVACMAFGYLFGYRRGADPLAQALFAHGLKHWNWQLERFFPGAYTGEGSTYYMDVVAPMAALGCAFAEAVTSQDWFNRIVGPNRITVRDVLEFGLRMTSPSGLMPPIDHYGYMTASTNLFTKIYCAARSNQKEMALSYVRFVRGEQGLNLFAWGFDDEIWSLIFFPDGVTDAPPFRATSFLNPHIAGRVVDEAQQLQLLQVWDSTVFPPGRQHCDPNAIHLEAFGQPLTFDGTPSPDSPIATDPRLVTLPVVRETGAKKINVGMGALGTHSCILLDGQYWYVHKHGTHVEFTQDKTIQGQGLDLVDLPGLRSVAADAAKIYGEYPDVRQVVRRSTLVDETFWFVHDRVVTDRTHDFTWRLYLRPEVQLQGNGAQQKLASARIQLDVLPLDRGRATLKDVPGFGMDSSQTYDQQRRGLPPPQNPTTYSQAYDRTLRDKGIEFLTALVPQNLKTLVADVSADWRFLAGKDAADETPAATTTDDSTWRTLGISESWINAGEPMSVKDGWYRKWVEIPSLPRGRRLLLELGRPPFRFRVYLDGIRVDDSELKMAHEGHYELLPVFLDLTKAAKPGRHLLAVHAFIPPGPVRKGVPCPTPGRLFDGPARLWVTRPAEKVTARLTAPGTAEVRIGRQRSLLLFDNPSHTVRSRGQWTTDAAMGVLRADGGWAWSRARRGDDRRFWFRASEPTDLALAGDVITIGPLALNLRLAFYGPELELQLEALDRIQIRIASSKSWSLRFSHGVSLPVQVNGCDVTPTADGDGAMVLLPCGGERTDVDALLEQLRADDPLSRLRAAETLGFVRDPRVVPALEKQLLAEPPPSSYKEGEGNYWMVRQQIIVALGRQGQPRSAKVIVKTTPPDDFYPIRRKAAEWLGQVGGDAASLKLLRQFAAEGDPEVRHAARKSLHVLGHEQKD